MDQYKPLKKLGEGAYGTVIKAVHISTGELVAIKKLKGPQADWQACLQMPEVKSLQKLNNCPQVIKIVQMIQNKSENEVNIVFEYCERNLY